MDTILNLKEKHSGGKSKKWKVWKSSSRQHGMRGRSDGSDTSADAFSVAVATVVRAPPKDFMAVRQEWAAIRIQTAFRGFLVIIRPINLICCFSILTSSIGVFPLASLNCHLSWKISLILC
jgi:hypothetical protein